VGVFVGAFAGDWKTHTHCRFVTANQVLTAANFLSENKRSDMLEMEEELDVELGTGRSKVSIETNGPVPEPSTALVEEEYNKTVTLWDPHDSIYRQVEANCTICFADYEVGDTLIRSAADDENEHCHHVFHYECMLAWLEKGTKSLLVIQQATCGTRESITNPSLSLSLLQL
jgi:Ring finger domain